MERGNKMFAALEAETDRGKACVGDAMLDELVKNIFVHRLVDSRAAEEQFSFGRSLGSHGIRLKIAHMLGWIGPETYHDCDKIHNIRNRMAHNLEVDSFEHEQVRDLVKALKGPKSVVILITKTGHDPQRVNLKRSGDVVTLAVSTAMLRICDSLDRSKRQRPGKDAPIFSGPKRIAQFLTEPKIPNVPI